MMEDKIIKYNLSDRRDIDLNEFCRVRLTEKGLDIYKQYVTDRANDFKNQFHLTPIEEASYVNVLISKLMDNNDGTYTLYIQVWELMCIYGESLYYYGYEADKYQNPFNGNIEMLGNMTAVDPKGLS